MKVLSKYSKRLVPVGMAMALVAALVSPAQAATYTSVTVTPTDPTAAVDGTTYTINVSSATAGTINCLRLSVDSSSGFGSGSLPTGFAVTGNPGGTLFSSGTWTNGPTTSTNTVTWLSSGGMTGASGSQTITFTADNPNSAGSYFVKIETFGNVDCSTSPLDNGTSAVVITSNTVVSVTVDASMTFTVANRATACNGEAGTYVDNSGGAATSLSLGTIAASQIKASAQNLSLTTNAGGGFNVYLRGVNANTNLRTAGNTASFDDVTGSGSAGSEFTGDERFGYTVNDTTSGSTGADMTADTWEALGNVNDLVMNGGTGIQTGSSCVSYQASADGSTPAGSYSATVIYTAVPTY